jgi:hypothetical protein
VADAYIPVQVVFPLEEQSWGTHRSCYYKCVEPSRRVRAGVSGYTASMVELVIDTRFGTLARVVLVSVATATRADPPPWTTVRGDPVFDLAAWDNPASGDRCRTVDASPMRGIDQYETFTVVVGDRRVTLPFEGRQVTSALQVGDHLIVLLDDAHEVSGFEFVGFSAEQWAQVEDTIQYQLAPLGRTIDNPT